MAERVLVINAQGRSTKIFMSGGEIYFRQQSTFTPENGQSDTVVMSEADLRFTLDFISLQQGRE